MHLIDWPITSFRGIGTKRSGVTPARLDGAPGFVARVLNFDELMPVALLHVVVEDDLKLFDDLVALEGGEEFAVDVDGGLGFFEGAGEGDADVGVLRLAGSIDDASHDGELELFDAGVLLLPLGHGFDEVVLDALGELLEVGGGGAAAAGAAGDLGHEAADGEGLQDLLGAADFFAAVAARGGGEGDADGVADTGEEERRQSGGGGYDALHAHAGFGEAEVERVVAALGEFGVDVDEVADSGDFGGEDDLVAAEAVAFGGSRVVESGDDHRFHHHVAGFERLLEPGVVVHHLGEERLVERAPVDADADGFLVLDGDFDHGAEVVVVLAADGAVAGIDAVLGEGFGAGGILGEELVAVVVEVADDGRVPALGADALDDVGHGFGGVVVVDGDADELGAGAGEGGDLLDGGLDVGGVGVGHRLDDDRGVGADTDAAYVDGDRFSAVNSGHMAMVILSFWVGRPGGSEDSEVDVDGVVTMTNVVAAGVNR